MLFELLFLFGAGFFGGVLNSVAGGGSFITFPALLFVGVAPISANATNTFASCAGYLGGAYAFRDNLYAHKKELPQLILISLIGGSLGAWLLLRTPESLFREAIPWLLLFATFLFIFGGKINSILKRLALHHRHASFFGHLLLLLVLLGTCIYGGFFNAGLGIIALSYLALAGHSNINTMNGMKLLISSVVSLIAIVLFIYNGVISWYEGGIVLIGTLMGGYVAAHISKQLSQQYVRAFVIIASCGITVYFFIATYVI
ncbi:MAG: sulfite exporter TauE/SafE family protein [Gammaproteobacteria bacterium]|nr:sulfite exporter TauE/SafE family protein [Gammaproteobacteria bacterium]